MRRRTALVSLFGLCIAPFAALAQPGKVWRIGFLQGGARPSNGLPPVALRKALAELRYVEGVNVAYEGRWAEGNFQRLPQLAAELVQSRVDAIIATGWLACRAAKTATTTIPIVTVGVGDVVESGLVASLSRPGGNLTGLSDMEAELSAKRLQVLTEAVPKASLIAVLWNQDDLGMTLRYRQLQQAARALGVNVQALGVRAPDDFDGAFGAMSRERPDALFLVTDALTNLNRHRVIDFAASNRIPTMYENGTYVRDGGLMSYGPNPEDGLRRVAYFVDRVLKGAKPSDLPMEQSTRYYLFINQNTAKALSFVIPQALLLRADQVID